MKVTRLPDVEPRPRRVAVGTFDGVHLGHRALIARAVASATELGCVSVVLTWDKHPNEVVHPERVPPLIATPERRIELLADRSPDLLVTLQFDHELSQWSPERFVEEVLVKGLAARTVFVGENWRFGKAATGTAQLLRELGSELGFDAEPVSPIILLFRLVPLSVIIFLGKPYRQMISFLMNLTTTFLVTLVYEAASTHLVK